MQTDVVTVGRVTIEIIEPQGSGTGVEAGDGDGAGDAAAVITTAKSMTGVKCTIPKY